MELYFSEYYEVDPKTLDAYGAFNISVVTDLPLFVDPFLLFNSQKEEYQRLHEDIITYLEFLRDEASTDLDPGLIKAWYRFKEVKQNWLGFTQFGNDGRALGDKFARTLHHALGSVLSNFGEETITQGSHLEKLTLIQPGVGKDSVSDFTTNLIKDYLLRYTEKFAQENIDPKYCTNFTVPKAAFNYNTKTWESRTYHLPELRGDFVVLTPLDMLSKDDTWINYSDMIKQFQRLPEAVDNDQLRAQINQYFFSRLGTSTKKADFDKAAQETIAEFRELIDVYIKLQEDDGDEALERSKNKALDTHRVLVEQVREAVRGLQEGTDFYDRPWTSYDEARQRALVFKHYVEDKDGWRVINRGGKTFASEGEVQLYFGLLWCMTEFDVNREPNNGRGPVDFKVSYGAGDKSLIEFKLAKNTQLKRNLANQIGIYEKANDTRRSAKVIVYYTLQEKIRADRILAELNLTAEESIILVDARSDNKQSASKV
ncbi:hypothetical protein [Nocardia brasiliensis]